MTKQSTFDTLTIVAMVPFLLALTNFVAIASFGRGFVPESCVNAACGFVCWLSFAVTAWVVYKAIESLTESY